MISKQKEIFNKLADKRLEEITNLDKKVNPDDLIYRYEGFTTFNPLDKIGDGKVILADAKFKSNLSEIKKGNKKHRSKEQKTHYITLKCFTKQGTVLLNFLMIILQWYMKQNLKQLKEEKLKY